MTAHAGHGAEIRERHTDLLETAAAHASMRVPLTTVESTVGEVLDGMRGRSFDTAAIAAVIDGDILCGVIALEQALARPPATPVAEVMDAHPPTVAPGVDQERAAWRAVRHGVAALAVVDADGRFRGVIPPRRLLAVLLAEHDEDIARLGGYLRSTEAASTAATEGVAHRLWHRLPWLALGLAGAFLAAVIVGSFEQQLERQVVLAFFLPGVVYLADAVGTQTEAVVIRGLSVGVSISRVARREAITGLLLGVLFALVSYPIVLLIWAEPPVAATVAVALFAASSIATVIAMVLPWALQRMGRDPAFGSGPLATVVQDLLSIAIYFATATAIAV
ncbi:magnesium transporter [Pseudonocardia eucalypti]|uniref:Magnesium transporter n=1 Tax=Pseudonocardia eucalypti TaxID=648755 RepID=A0ABP9QI56_9PSEU|nr:magnesium transporter [Pseudonocardia eucalypti]